MKNSLRKFALIFLATLFFVPLLIGVVGAMSPASPVEALENAYKVQLEAAHKSLDSACTLETELAKAKLTDHYSDKTKLTPEQLTALQSKAEGQNLSCREGFLSR